MGGSQHPGGNGGGILPHELCFWIAWQMRPSVAFHHLLFPFGFSAGTALVGLSGAGLFVARGAIYNYC